MRHVIIGTGAAGISAAKTIRKCSKEDEIIMISADEIVNSRCLLHKYIGGQRDADSLSFVPPEFFEENGIKWITGVARGIDTGKKLVRLENEDIPYDRLLIAAGADSVTPPIGALRTAENVFGLRHFTDAEAIKKAARDADKIVIIGAGLVGLDAAFALIELGKRQITIVEMGRHILPLNLDGHAAKAYQELFEEHGCTFRLGSRVTDTRCSDGLVSGVVLDSGEAFPCDMVIVAAGVRPSITFLTDSGINCDRAVTVDGSMRTSAPDVFAAGDVTGLSGIWPNAVLQGEVAAKNMCGESAVYEDTFATKNTLNFFGLITLAAGKTEPDEGDNVLIREDRRTYKKLILTGDAVAGVILQGDIAGSGFWQYLIKNRINITETGKSPWDLSYADFFDVGADGEYIWKSA